jgi:hypothetical protein
VPASPSLSHWSRMPVPPSLSHRSLSLSCWSLSLMPPPSLACWSLSPTLVLSLVAPSAACRSFAVTCQSLSLTRWSLSLPCLHPSFAQGPSLSLVPISPSLSCLPVPPSRPPVSLFEPIPAVTDTCDPLWVQGPTIISLIWNTCCTVVLVLANDKSAHYIPMT